MSGSEHEYWGKLAKTFHGDALLLVNLLHIVESPIAVLKESHRVLSNDGRIVIVDVTGPGMCLLKKMRLGIRYLRKFGKTPSNNKSFRQDELAADRVGLFL
jgi:ubiquinone/menaquinone biosynthesis C-methylase UbiE